VFSTEHSTEQGKCAIASNGA